jgi:predicted nucleotide-binding protein (sugar kinase/HSP70/actin superfamily)
MATDCNPAAEPAHATEDCDAPGGSPARPGNGRAARVRHFRSPLARHFLAEDRHKVTVLFGGFTWKHERLIAAILRRSGYRCQQLPTPDLAAFALGKEYGNNGQCNPTYFTIGNLIKFLRSLEERGLSRREIVEGYIFFTAGSCGPCRFGMYESEYRLALENAGYSGFRLVLYQAEQAIKAAAENTGLQFTVDFNLGALNMLYLGDMMNDLSYRIRPFEIVPGSTNRAVDEVVDSFASFLEHRRRFEILERLPRPAASLVARSRGLKGFLDVTGKVLNHLYSREFVEEMHRAQQRLGELEVDHTRVKPVVKIVGEFWAQLTEGDGNFNMFAFLEREGAQVHIESISGWIDYLLYQSRKGMEARKGLDYRYNDARWLELGRIAANRWGYRRKWLLLRGSERAWEYLYARTAKHLGGITPPLVRQRELARLAHPFYHSLARGGEGHLEVGKNVYYTTNKLCHMVLALKPFGCMPSSQSDGVQSAVVNRFPEMTFLPIETAGEGEINAYSRVQMALGEARARARTEFEVALGSTGHSLDAIREFAGAHRRLRSPFYPFPRRPGVAGAAANFVMHAGRLMDGRERMARLPGER